MHDLFFVILSARDMMNPNMRCYKKTDKSVGDNGHQDTGGPHETNK